MKYEKLELHLAPFPLSRAHAKRIKACGGWYSECRGYANRRFVTLPVRERGLIDALVRTYSGDAKITMIARDDAGGRWLHVPSWVVVQDVDPRASIPPLMQFEQKFTLAHRQAVERGIIKETQS